MNKKIMSKQLIKILVHILFWGLWIYLAVSNANEDEWYNRTCIMFGLIVGLHIPLFFLNTEILVPRILQRRGVTAYVISLLIAIVIFAVLHHFFKELLFKFFPFERYHKSNVFWNVVPMLFVAGISTAYSLLSWVVRNEQREREAKQERLQSELSFLRSQISPHFIFNMLNSVVYLIRTQSNQAEPTTIKLSELMRYMLYDADNEQITLEQELAYLHNYIDLQKIRFEEDVQITVVSNGAPTTQQIEPMLMIPFVENAFKHGVGMIPQPSIDINIHITDERLDFSVVNKIAPELLNQKDQSTGIGLKNVRRRLELLYPNRHHLHIGEQNGVFSVALQLRFGK
jgi:two-component system, LytTR family, sensor kinase